jgi:hypothetical protein
MVTRTVVDTRTDRHGNICKITKVSGRRDAYCQPVDMFTVKYDGETRCWVNRKTGSPYFMSVAAARAKIIRN